MFVYCQKSIEVLKHKFQNTSLFFSTFGFNLKLLILILIRKFISPAISPLRPPNVKSGVTPVKGPSGTEISSPASNPAQNLSQSISRKQSQSSDSGKSPICCVCGQPIR